MSALMKPSYKNPESSVPWECVSKNVLSDDDSGHASLVLDSRLCLSIASTALAGLPFFRVHLRSFSAWDYLQLRQV
jgi:hypothetical protein